MLRKVLAGIAGLIAALAVITFIQLLGHFLIPPPADLDFTDADAVAAAMRNMPVAAFLFVILSYLSGAFVGAFVGAWIAGSHRTVYAVLAGSLVLVGTVLNLLTIPHPIWFAVVALAGIPVAAWFGARSAPRRVAA